MPRAYAAGTSVSVEKTRSEMAGLLGRHGATHYAFGKEPLDGGGTVDLVAFQLAGRRYKFTVIHPTWDDVKGNYVDPSRVQNRTAAIEGELMRRWRARLLWLKATLEFMDGEGESNGVDYLLPFLMLPDGQTMADWAEPQVDAMYATGRMPPLLGSGT